MAHFINTNGQPADVCSYSEAAYCGGFAFQHIADRDEADRLARKRADGRKAAERLARDRRAMGSRYGMTGRRALDKAATA